MIRFVAVTERVNYFIADTHPALVHRISELLLTCLRPTSHRRVFTRRQPVDRVRPVDVWFQVNVHCVSVWDMDTIIKAVMMMVYIVPVVGLTVYLEFALNLNKSENHSEFTYLQLQDCIVLAVGVFLGLIAAQQLPVQIKRFRELGK